MQRTRKEVRDFATESEKDRLEAAEKPAAQWWEAWTQEAVSRYERLESGVDPGLTLEQFWSDERDGDTQSVS